MMKSAKRIKGEKMREMRREKKHNLDLTEDILTGEQEEGVKVEGGGRG